MCATLGKRKSRCSVQRLPRAAGPEVEEMCGPGLPKCAVKGRALGAFELEALEGCFMKLVVEFCDEA
jgi:hypothetical protein